MLEKFKRLFSNKRGGVSIEWIRRNPNAWICRNFAAETIRTPDFPIFQKIENLAQCANALGQQPLWEGYENLIDYKFDVRESAARTSDDVRSSRSMGIFYAHLASRRKPKIIVEFGTAFGVSGMYWLAGLENNSVGGEPGSENGKLLTFEPNEVWAKIARGNLSEISRRFKLTVGTFEGNIGECLNDGETIDIAFIDAIHTSEFVLSQFEIVLKHINRANGLVLFDDIAFSDDMRACWKKIAADERVRASGVLAGRVGIVEV